MSLSRFTLQQRQEAIFKIAQTLDDPAEEAILDYDLAQAMVVTLNTLAMMIQELEGTSCDLATLSI